MVISWFASFMCRNAPTDRCFQNPICGIVVVFLSGFRWILPSTSIKLYVSSETRQFFWNWEGNLYIKVLKWILQFTFCLSSILLLEFRWVPIAPHCFCIHIIICLYVKKNHKLWPSNQHSGISTTYNELLIATAKLPYLVDSIYTSELKKRYHKSTSPRHLFHVLILY